MPSSEIGERIKDWCVLACFHEWANNCPTTSTDRPTSSSTRDRRSKLWYSRWSPASHTLFLFDSQPQESGWRFMTRLRCDGSR